jgi:hypothetical protein
LTQLVEGEYPWRSKLDVGGKNHRPGRMESPR